MNTILMLVANKTITSEAIANHIINMPGWTLASWVTEQDQLQRENLIHPPDCILLDDSFFELETVIHINLLTTQYHNAKILLIASQLDQQLFANAMDAGAKGIISPMHANLDQLSEAVGCIANGRTYLCQAAMELLVGGLFSRNKVFCQDSEISLREKQIIRLIAEGHSSKEIAKILVISPATVDTHRKNIMRKIGAHKIAEITRYAIKAQILQV